MDRDLDREREDAAYLTARRALEEEGFRCDAGVDLLAGLAWAAIVSGYPVRTFRQGQGPVATAGPRRYERRKTIEVVWAYVGERLYGLGGGAKCMVPLFSLFVPLRGSLGWLLATQLEFELEMNDPLMQLALSAASLRLPGRAVGG
jgi:hypothetical protein